MQEAAMNDFARRFAEQFAMCPVIAGLQRRIG
jgi:hypothetical protein